MECNELFSDNFFMKLEHDHEILLDFVLVYHSLHDIAQCFEKQDNFLRREDLDPLFALSTLTVYKLCDENEDEQIIIAPACKFLRLRGGIKI